MKKQATKKLDNTSKKIGIKPVEREKNGQLKPGVQLNPAGRPKGSKNFYTDFSEAILNLKDKKTGEPLTELHIIREGIEKMLKGDARFEGLFKDLMDRIYGKPVQINEITGKGGKDLIPDKQSKEKTDEVLNRFITKMKKVVK